MTTADQIDRLAEPIHLLSLGAGVQSSTLALMAAHGECEPMPVAAIFADTQAEPASVYRWLDWLEKQLPFPVHRVTRGNLTDDALRLRQRKDGDGKWTKTIIPVFIMNRDGSKGHLHRACTYDYKSAELTKAARRLAGIKRGQKTIGVIQWIGISLDELQRMKPSREPWCQHRWPLIEKRMTRQKCLEWMESHGYPMPPRSACVYCPFHSNAEWRRLQREEPEEFARAVQFERDLHEATAQTRMDGVPYLHSSLKPLDSIDFRSDVDKGQMLFWQDECMGMCGV